METSNFLVTGKKFWRIVRTALLMLKKGMAVSKTKLMLDLNLVLKRGKIAGKAAIQNLMLFNHTHNLSAGGNHPKEYEFSCSNSPAYPGGGSGFHLPFASLHKKDKHRRHAATFDDIVAANAVLKALEILHSEAPSPALPGFGRTPVVRQLRVTDSPFPIRDVEENGQVDKAAEAFISKFYNSLRRQCTE